MGSIKMTMKNKYEKNNNTDYVLGNNSKNLNISQSDESFEEYTDKELKYIDKYKPMTMNRMSDEEVYDIIVKFDFNDEKIESELKEFKLLINHKGDDYGWNVIDKGNKKKIFLNETKDKTKGNKNYKNNNYKNQNSEGYYNNNYKGNYYSYNNNYNGKYKNNYNQVENT